MSDPLAHFTDRQAQIDAYDRLWQRDTPWVLAFDGLSGNGKSTLLDWLIANRCRPRNTPHARLDLYGSEMREYASLLDTLVDGLRPHLPGAEYARYDARCRAAIEARDRRRIEINVSQVVTAGGGSDISGVQQHMQMGLDKLRQDAERQARDELTRAALDLLEALPGKPVLFFDTYEALQRGGDEELESWLWDRLLHRAHARCPALRIVVAGRDRLRLPHLAPACAPSELPFFTEDQCHAFLRKRGIAEAGLRAGIYRLTGGHPLLTDMAAELWHLGREGGRPLTLSELDAAPRADGRTESTSEDWLYGRILDRLDGATRAAARYGVLLRRFDRATLNAALPQGAALDEDAFARFVGHTFIEVRAAGAYQAHDLVRRAQMAWLRRADPDALSAFHRRAEAHYRGRYGEIGDPDDLAEALYHRCWHDEKDGLEEWEETTRTHTLVADRERWRGVVRALEGTEWAEKPLREATRARYAYRRGMWHYYSTEWNAALQSYNQALDLFRQVGSRLGEAGTIYAIGEVARISGDYAQAQHHYHIALTTYESIEARLGQANVLDSLGELAEAQGAWVESVRWFEKALKVYQAINAPYARTTEQNLERVRERLKEEA